MKMYREILGENIVKILRKCTGKYRGNIVKIL